MPKKKKTSTSHECFDCASEALAGKNTRLSYVLDITADTYRPQLVTVKIDPKTRGKPAVIAATFCPFCGRKL